MAACHSPEVPSQEAAMPAENACEENTQASLFVTASMDEEDEKLRDKVLKEEEDQKREKKSCIR
jgi:hypothetical protein